MCAAKVVTVWDAKNGHRKQSFIPRLAGEELSEIVGCCLDGRKRKLIIGDNSGQLSVLSANAGTFMKLLDPHSRKISALSYCEADKCAISASSDGVVQITNESSDVGYHLPLGGGPPQPVLLRTIVIGSNPVSSANSRTPRMFSRQSISQPLFQPSVDPIETASKADLKQCVTSYHQNLIATLTMQEAPGMLRSRCSTGPR